MCDRVLNFPFGFEKSHSVIPDFQAVRIDRLCLVIAPASPIELSLLPVDLRHPQVSLSVLRIRLYDLLIKSQRLFELIGQGKILRQRLLNLGPSRIELARPAGMR